MEVEDRLRRLRVATILFLRKFGPAISILALRRV
jgi:hypothetical protein